MRINRRRFCSTALLGSTATVVGNVSAQSSTSVSITVRSEVGANVTGSELYFSNIKTNEGPTIELPSGGETDATLPEQGTYRVTLFDRLDPTEDIPLLYQFDNVTVDNSNTDLEFLIPEAYNTQIKFVDTNGNPIDGLSVNLRTKNGTTGFRNDFTTTKQGFIRYLPVSKTGVELVGGVDVELQSGRTLDTINVTESTQFEITVSEQKKTISLSNGIAELIEPTESNDFNFPYVLYRPDVSENTTLPLCIRPHNSTSVRTQRGLNSQLIGENSPVYSELFSMATENQFPGIIPGFPRTPNDGPDVIQTLALPSYRSELISSSYRLDAIATNDFSAQSLERIDKQLLAMISDAKNRLDSEPYSVAEQVHMAGFSAGATFSNRFAFLYPSKVQTLTTGGSVVLPLPQNSYDGITLRYPLGTEDYEALTGKEFDKEAWKDINRYIFLGEEDNPQPGSRSQWYGSLRYLDLVSKVHGDRRVTERFPFIKSQYNTAAPNTSTFELFEGVGHSVSPEMEQAAVEYHKNTADPKTKTLEVEIVNPTLDPSTVSTESPSSHTLEFTAKNVSADGTGDEFADEFDVVFPEEVILEGYSNVDIDAQFSAVEQSGNTLTFSVSPGGGGTTQVSVEMNVTLSPANSQ